MTQPTPQLPECSDGQSAGTDLGHGIPGASFEYSPLLLGPLETMGAQSAHPHATATLTIAPRRRKTTSLVRRHFTATFYDFIVDDWDGFVPLLPALKIRTREQRC